VNTPDLLRTEQSALRDALVRPAKLNVALFDLDHTLIPIDSDHAWGVFTTTIGWTDPVAFQRQNDAFFAEYRAGTLDIADYVRFATEAIRRQGATDSHAAHLRFMQEVVLPAITPQARALVDRHRQAGDALVIVTATNEFVTAPIARAFDVDELIAVELERHASGDAAGWFTGQIKGVPSAREGKVTRVAQWLSERGLDWTDVRTTFYTDSINDLSLMERVSDPVATNPDERLRSVATERGWRILELFPQEI